MPKNSPPHLEVLLSEAVWTRRLARRLVADASDAEDLVQETWATALQRAPAPGTPVLAWIGRVMRNLARQRRRAQVRRGLREHAAARDEHVSAEQELLDRFEQHRILAEEVARLDEPYRSSILQRYFDGLSPKEIARRSREPVRTVHSRLNRGLALLRKRIQRRSGGDSRSWFLALVPLGWARGGLTGPIVGGLIVNTQAKVAIAVVVIGALAATGVYVQRARPSAPRAAFPEPRAPAVPEFPNAPPPTRSPSSERTVVASDSPHATAVPSRARGEQAAVTVRGRVVDPDGLPVPEVQVGLCPAHSGGRPAPEPRTLTLHDGSFSLSVEQLPCSVTVTSEDWVALFEPGVARSSSDSLLVIAARAIDSRGRTVDEGQAPLEGVELDLLLPDAIRVRFPAVLDGAPAVQRSTRSDAQGRFELTRLPGLPGATLRARRQGFETATAQIPDRSRDDIVIVLARPAQETMPLSGIVVDEAGAPARDALVSLGETSARTDAEGAFTLRLDLAGPGRLLQAVLEGHLPARLECAAASARDRGAWPAPLVLRLGGPPLAIAGVVSNAQGRPVPQAKVWIVDLTYLGKVEVEFGNEFWMIDDWIEGQLNRELDPHFGDGCVTADGEGRYRLEGLLPRSYRLQALDPRTFAYGQATSIEAGREDVVIAVACESEIPTLGGRVVSRSGAPIAGAWVRPGRKILRARAQIEPADEEVDAWSEGVHTDAQGRFAFDGMCSATSSILVTHQEGLGDTCIQLASVGPLDRLEIVLLLKCHLQVDLEGSSIEANNLRLLDQHGEPLGMTVYHGNVSYGFDSFYFEGRKTEALVVPETAATLVLLQGERELRRIPLYLRPGELNVVRP